MLSEMDINFEYFVDTLTQSVVSDTVLKIRIVKAKNRLLTCEPNDTGRVPLPSISEVRNSVASRMQRIEIQTCVQKIPCK